MLDETTDRAELASADPNLTRKMFLNKVVKGAALTGGLAVAPKVLDKFLVQSVAACTPPSSGCLTAEGASTASGATDTHSSAPCSDAGPFPIGEQTTVTAATIGGGDTLNCCGDTGVVLNGTVVAGGGTDNLDCKGPG